MKSYFSIVPLYLSILSAASGSEIYIFQATKIRMFEQVSESHPTEPVLYIFDSFIDTNPEDISSAMINGQALDQVDPGIWVYYSMFQSQLELDAAMPGASFDMEIQSLICGELTESLLMPIPELYPSPPVFTSSTMQSLSDVNTLENLVISWSEPGIETDLINIIVYGESADHSVFDGQLPSDQTQFLIPAGSLQPSESYTVEVAFFNARFSNGVAGSGFGIEAAGVAGYVSSTLVSMTTRARCQPDFTGEGDLNFLDISAFLTAYGSQDPVVDFHQDGLFNFLDVSAFLAAFGAGCP